MREAIRLILTPYNNWPAYRASLAAPTPMLMKQYLYSVYAICPSIRINAFQNAAPTFLVRKSLKRRSRHFVRPPRFVSSMNSPLRLLLSIDALVHYCHVNDFLRYFGAAPVFRDASCKRANLCSVISISWDGE